MLNKLLQRSILRMHSRSLNFRGDVQWRRGNLQKAEAYFRTAISKNRKNAAAFSNLGAVLINLHRYDEGMSALEYAVQLNPRHPGALVNLGNAYYQSKAVSLAIEKYLEALDAEPGNSQALANVLYPLMETCDWGRLSKYFEIIRNRIADDKKSAFRLITPFTSLHLPLSRNEQLIIARQSANEWEGSIGRFKARAIDPKSGTGRPIRIGYLSSDFHDHATAHLTLGIYGLHDRKCFEVYAYSCGYPDSSPYRQKIVRDCDKFIDVHHLDAQEVAKQIGGDGIDILVDLKGYTSGSRPAVLALRPAPIQVNYLGYPGTMGANFIDYLIADSTVIPENHANDYSEKIICLPNTYQATDDKQPIDDIGLTRQQAGLPEDGFVYCCFNTPAKINRDAFACWMTILGAASESVLWLMQTTEDVRANLNEAAAASGIDAKRLVYASHLPKAAHLARLRLADLCLDTFIYNAHTTATDALWAGVPILTLIGETFASRVAASLLNAVGLQNFITTSKHEYIALAIKLATDAKQMESAKQLLLRKTEKPLFSTANYVRNLEDAYREMVRDSRFRNNV